MGVLDLHVCMCMHVCLEPLEQKVSDLLEWMFVSHRVDAEKLNPGSQERPQQVPLPTGQSLQCPLRFIFILYVRVYSLNICKFTMCLQHPQKPERGCRIPSNCSYKWLWAMAWVQGNECRSSTRAANTSNHRSISSALAFHIFIVKTS